MSIKHSKFKNTYLIYEFLVRQTLSDLLDDKQLKESMAFNIIKSNFSKGMLKEELMLYQALVNTRIKNRKSTDYLMGECIKRYNSLPSSKLRERKYNLIGEIKKNYDINKLFNTQLPEYSQAGAVYMLFESHKKHNVVKKAKYMGVISDNLRKPKEGTKGDKIFECINGASPSDRKLAYKILLESFNKTANQLTESQQKYIKKYVYNNTNESGWINESIQSIRGKIDGYSKKIEKEDRVLSLKINECVRKIDKIANKKILKEEDHSKILKMYKLTDLLDSYEEN